MDVTFQRLGGNRYFANAARADGVTVRVPGYDRTSAIPHDLAHFVAEREFGVTRGFWGSVAAGALFTNMVVVSGRQKPHAAERSKQIIKAHADDLGMSEALAGAVHDAVEQDLTLDEVMKRLRAYWGITSAAPLPVAAADAEPAINALRHAAERWAAVAVDEGLTLTWPLPVEKVSLPRTGRSQRSRRGR
ncbi:hypothetical protein BZB76_1196 [Actinomadura pelletieri DSM 43383]|uniref:Uncharacterized protein n=1 Tax=Actinomadura pelletieri DSM 43383 TaxID=1120940 RepID=A0A495QZS4_9ACTN|nr:hypothetical protein [Actinomadura pelletieri]RKS79719.1 hypothetical protein BZB76_1196 [Actinomadura pelletieri DSM 43383]